MFNSYVKLPEGIADLLLQMNVQSDEFFAKQHVGMSENGVYPQ